MKKFKGFRVGEKVLVNKNLINEYKIKDRSGTMCTLTVQPSQRELEGKICTIKHLDDYWTNRLNCPVFKVKEDNQYWISSMCSPINSIYHLLEERCTK